MANGQGGGLTLWKPEAPAPPSNPHLPPAPTRKCKQRGKTSNCHSMGNPHVSALIQPWTSPSKWGRCSWLLPCPANLVLLTNRLGLILEVLELSELSYERIVNRNLERRKEGQVESQNNIANGEDENLCALQKLTDFIPPLLFTFGSKEETKPSSEAKPTLSGASVPIPLPGLCPPHSCFFSPSSFPLSKSSSSGTFS